jgi:hypothetical protein
MRFITFATTQQQCDGETLHRYFKELIGHQAQSILTQQQCSGSHFPIGGIKQNTSNTLSFIQLFNQTPKCLP